MSTTLLAVDDSATMRKVLEITFSGEEFRVVTADSADAALKKARSERPGLILLDVTLAGQDGYALCKTIKAEMPGVPVLILSSKQGPYDATKGSAAGADEFADKPFDTQQILDKVRRVLQAKGAGASAATPPAVPATPPPVPTGKPGAGTLPGSTPAAASATPPQAAGQPASRSPQTQAFGSSPPARSTQPGAAPPQVVSARTSTPTLGVQPGAAPGAAGADLRTRTASGLGTAAAQAQLQAQGSKTQPALPAQLQGNRPNTTPSSTAPAGAAAAPSAVGTAIDEKLSSKLAEIGLTATQVDAVLALSREVVERVVWEVVPVLAETIIKEELKRLTSES